MDIINLNGVEYVKRNKITEIEAERDKLQKDLEAIRKIVGVSLKDASEILTEVKEKQEEKKEEKQQKKKTYNRRPNRKPYDAFEPLDSAKKLFKIRHMDEDGKFFTANHKPLVVTIKHVLEVQKFLHKNVTNKEVNDLAKKFGINYQIVNRLVWNYQQHTFDKYIAQWNKMTQPKVGMKNRPIQNNPEKRKEAGIYN